MSVLHQLVAIKIPILNSPFKFKLNYIAYLYSCLIKGNK